MFKTRTQRPQSIKKEMREALRTQKKEKYIENVLLYYFFFTKEHREWQLENLKKICIRRNVNVMRQLYLLFNRFFFALLLFLFFCAVVDTFFFFYSKSTKWTDWKNKKHHFGGFLSRRLFPFVRTSANDSLVFFFLRSHLNPMLIHLSCDRKEQKKKFREEKKKTISIFIKEIRAVLLIPFGIVHFMVSISIVEWLMCYVYK